MEVYIDMSSDVDKPPDFNYYNSIINELKSMRKYDDTNRTFTIDEIHRSKIIEIIKNHGGLINNTKRGIDGLFSLAMYFVIKK